MGFALTVVGASVISFKTRHPAPPGNFFAKAMHDRGWTDVGCVEPDLLTSSDDALFVCSGDVKEGSRPEWRVANAKGSWTRSVYQTNPQAQFSCSRIAGSFTMVGNGTLAPVVFRVTQGQRRGNSRGPSRGPKGHSSRRRST